MEYLSLDSDIRSEYVVKRSRFICDLRSCSTYEELKDILNEIKNEFPDATHHCHGYIGIPGSNEMDFKDDGEPGGTAGMPILNTLKVNSLEGVVAVVTRYFGGVKLGASGLSAAYARSVQEAIDSATKARCIFSKIYSSSLPYSSFDTFKSAGECLFDILDVEYGERVYFDIAVPVEEDESFARSISELTCSRFDWKESESRFHRYPGNR